MRSFAWLNDDDDGVRLHSSVRKLFVSRNLQNQIEGLSVEVNDETHKRLQNKREYFEIENLIRNEVAILLITTGEVEWSASETDDGILDGRLPNCEISINSKNDAEQLFIESWQQQNAVVAAQQIADGLFFSTMPVGGGMNYNIWICGVLNNPDFAFVSHGFSHLRFGREFEGIKRWVMFAISDNASLSRQGMMLADLLSTAAFPEALSKYPIVSEEEYRVEAWEWDVNFRVSAGKSQKFGVLKMQPLNTSRTEFKNWSEKSFNLSIFNKDVMPDFALSKLFPSNIICKRNRNQEVFLIECFLQNVEQIIRKIDVLDGVAAHVLGMFLCVGALDAGSPDNMMTPGGWPIGMQKIRFAKNAEIKFFSGVENKEFASVPIKNALSLNDGLLKLSWMRALDGDNHLSHAFSADYDLGGDLLLHLSRTGQGEKLGDPFYYPQASSFSIAHLFNGNKNMTWPQIEFFRTHPSPSYFVCLDAQETQAQLQKFQENLVSSTNAKMIVPPIGERLNELLAWLSVEDAGLVLRTLHEINMAKERWARSPKTLSSSKITWEDIQPFLKVSIKDLPCPQNGEYV